VPGDFLEAVAFAWLAQQALHGVPIDLTHITGARHPHILGAIYRNK
jgi:anhydro-N-acetylmuramic acid kinase